MPIKQLEAIFKEVHSLPILFIGSGFSRRYIDTPNWENLLSVFAEICTGKPHAFGLYRAKALKQLRVEGLNNDKMRLFPLIATLIEDDFNIIWYEAEKYENSRKKYTSLIKKGISPFKIEVSEYLKKYSSINSEHSDEISAFKKVVEKSVASIITTNYDTLLDELSDFNVFIGQSELLFQKDYGMGDLFKIHGSVTKPESIVLNKSDYDEFANKQKYLASKLLTLFVENPILFLGYSINDENIIGILESISECLTDNQLEHISKRMFFIEYKKDATKITYSKRSIRFKSKEIHMTEITLSSYHPLFESILTIKAKHSVKLLRILEKHFHTLVYNRNAENKLLVMKPDELIENLEDDAEVIVGFGVKELGKHGYGGIKSEQIYKDTIYDDQGFEINYLVELTLPELLPHISYSLPVYKYIDSYEGNLPEVISSRFLNFDFDKLRNSSILLKMESVKRKSVDDIVNNTNSINQKMISLAALPEETLRTQLDSLEKFIKIQLETNPRILISGERHKNASCLRKLIRMYDYLKYKK